MEQPGPNDPSIPRESLFFQMLEEDRYRLARLLQDGPGQLLANAATELDQAVALLRPRSNPAIRGLRELRDEIVAGSEELSALVAELHPPLLSELGLTVALDRYLSTFERRTGICLQFDASSGPRERLPSIMETAIFRIVQEAIENVRDHSGANRVMVILSSNGSRVSATIADNGRGFPEPDEGGASRRSLGLLSMRDRAKLLGGQLHIFSENGRGVRVVAEIPYHSDVGQADLSQT